VDRINFSARTKRIVAARAGYRCSIPGCGRVTIGPDPAPDKFALTGIAAHVFSASKQGPRGRGGLSKKQLESAANAVWLCTAHAKLVDANRGASYPPSLLISYKGLQEAKTAREQGGIFAPIAWIQQLTVHKSPLFRPKTTLRFGKVTLITGDNCSGNSALCDWLAGVGDQAALWRWLPRPNTPCELDIEVLCHTPEEQIVRLAITPAGILKFSINNKGSPIQPLPLRFVSLKEEGPLHGWRGEERQATDDIDRICARLNVDPLTVENLFPIVEADGIGWVSNLRLVDERDEDDEISRKRLLADVRGEWRRGLQFGLLENWGRTCILVELAIAFARFSAQFTPTMILFDGGIHGLDHAQFDEMTTYLSSAHHPFQTVIVTPKEDAPKLRWAGWELIRLQRGSSGTTVSQHIR
jgi:hypothetical protein